MKKNKPTSPRVQRNREAAKQAILDAARAIMREEGVAALSMQELARRMDMRAPSLYNYFTGKMDIYDALFRLGYKRWGEIVEKAAQESTTFREEIGRVIEGYMTFALENPEFYQLCFERPVPGFIPSQESLDLSFGILEFSRKSVETYKHELNTDLTSEQIVNLTIAVLHGLTAMHMANEPHLPVGQGRFGSLIPAALSMLEAALVKKG
ncbi:MAG: TetR/AcrR family transcriptional regulator [Anaerolineales bacterium]|nr:MAG: TetR/AcrR family transcriptional regulator [Anaerolineales bacterium]